MTKNITVQKILGILLHRIKFILITTFVAGLLVFLYTSFFITPMYSASTMIFIQNYNKSTKTTDDPDAGKSDKSKSQSDANQSNNETAKKIFYSDINSSAALAKICVTLFQNSDTVTSVYDGCNVSFSVVPDTFYITIDVSGSDPKKCANVANQVADQCASVFHEWLAYGQIGTIRKAVEPGKPYSPDKLKNTLIGLAVGLVASCLISILLELIDTTIRPDEDLSELYDIPVFAEIPDFESSGR